MEKSRYGPAKAAEAECILACERDRDAGKDELKFPAAERWSSVTGESAPK